MRNVSKVRVFVLDPSFTIVLIVALALAGCHRADNTPPSDSNRGPKNEIETAALHYTSKSSFPTNDPLVLNQIPVHPGEEKIIRGMLADNPLARAAVARAAHDQSGDDRDHILEPSAQGRPAEVITERDKHQILKILFNIKDFERSDFPGDYERYDSFILVIIPGAAKHRKCNVYLIKPAKQDWILLQGVPNSLTGVPLPSSGMY